MSESVVRLAGSSKSVFSAWQSLRKSAEKDSVRRGSSEKWGACQSSPASRGTD